MKNYWDKWNKTILFYVLCSMFYGSVWAKTIEQVVAVVGSDVITLYDLDRAMAPFAAERRKSERELANFRKKILEDLVHQKLLEQEIAKSEIEVNDADLSRTIAGILGQNRITIDQLQQELSSKGISFEAYKDQLRGQIRQYKFIQQNLASRVQVSQADIQNYRKNHSLEDDSGTRLRLAWIFLPLEGAETAKERRKLLEKGQKICDRARGGENFEDLTKEREMLLKELPSDLAFVVKKMEPNAISDPVSTPQGIFIAKLFEKQFPAPVSAGNGGAMSENEIYQRIFNERLDGEIRNFVLRLRKKAYVEIKG